jgi:hypothetical protein
MAKIKWYKYLGADSSWMWIIPLVISFYSSLLLSFYLVEQTWQEGMSLAWCVIYFCFFTFIFTFVLQIILGTVLLVFYGVFTGFKERQWGNFILFFVPSLFITIPLVYIGGIFFKYQAYLFHAFFER